MTSTVGFHGLQALVVIVVELPGLQDISKL